MRMIDADKLKRKVQRIATEAWMMKLNASVETTLNQFIDYIDEAPTIDIEPKRGEWIDEADKYDASFGIHDYRCSNCNSYADEYICGHEWYIAGKPNFCPHCGADMRERKESE